MNIHQNSEDEYMKYNCSICGKQILTKKKLKQHQDAVHKNKEFKCAQCNHWLKSRCSLRQHIRAVHDCQSLFILKRTARCSRSARMEAIRPKLMIRAPSLQTQYASTDALSHNIKTDVPSI